MVCIVMSERKKILWKKSPFVLFALSMLLLWMTGCPAPPEPPPPAGLTIKTVKITSPETGKIYNATNDGDKTKPGIQVTVEVELATEGEGAFPSGVKAELSTNNKRIAPVDVKGTKITFQNYTLEEGENSLQVKITLADNTVLNSNTVLLTADSQCYQINIITPKDGALLGARDDENANKPELQQTVIVQVNKDAVEPIKLTIRDEQGQETTLERKPFEGEVAFDEVTLPNGKVTLIASIEDSAGNKCEATSSFMVRVDSPAVEITTPSATQQLCPKDDKDPKTSGFQVDAIVKTSAEDKSEATLFLDGRKLTTTVVSGGQATFNLTLSDLKEEFQGTLKASVTDTLGNVGESKEVIAQGRSRGYELTLLGVLPDQTIPPSRDTDPNTPGIQISVELKTSGPDTAPVEFTLNGAPLKVTLVNGTAKLTLTLIEGQNCMEAKVKEASCALESSIPKTCVTVRPIGLPTLSCELTEKMAPKFDANDHADLSGIHDADDQTAGVQNTIHCQTDAEKDQVVEFDLNSTKQTKPLVDGQNNLREVTFDKLTFIEGANTVTIKVTNKNGKSETKTYTIDVDTTPPSAVTDLVGAVSDRRLSSVKLSWTAPGDGTKSVTTYEVRYTSLLPTITATDWEKPEGKLTLSSTKKPGDAADDIVTKLSIATTYLLAIRARDAGGNLSPISNVVSVKIDFKTNTTKETGPGDQFFGHTVAMVGDLDKDGIVDIAVTELIAKDGTKTNVGAVHIYYGRDITKGSYLAPQPDATIIGEGAANTFGQHVVGMGDLNGDGFDDIAISSARVNSNKGRVYIVFGGQRNTTIKNDNIINLAKVIISSDTPAIIFGLRLAAVGTNGLPDLNGDNKPDLIITAPGAPVTGKTTKGKAYVFYSRAAYPTGTQPALSLGLSDADIVFENDTIPNATSGDSFFGSAVVATDLDRDGKADIIFGASRADTVVGFYGPLTPTNKVIQISTASFSIKGDKTGNQSFGSYISVAGDVNKDSKLDLLISAKIGQAPGQATTSGQVFLFSGTKLIKGAKLATDTDAELTWYGHAASNFLEITSAAGDLNGDGFADFYLVEGKADSTTPPINNAGAVYLFFGRTKFSDIKQGEALSSANFIWWGSGPDQRLGFYGFVGGFDLTGDKYPDFLVAETPINGKSLKGTLNLKY